MTFTYPSPSFDSPVYNPLNYSTLTDSITLELANTLYLSKNDFRLSYLNSITPGIGAAGSLLCLDSSRNISNINDIACSTINGTNTSGLTYLSALTPGFASGGKALVVDSNRDIATIKKISTSHTSPYTAFESNQSTTQIALQLNNVGSNSFGTTSAHGFSLMTSNTNRLTISSTGAVDISGSLNCSSLSIGGSSINLTPLAYLTGITEGFASASKALVVDANRDIATIKKISTSHTSPYTAFESNQSSAQISLQMNSLGYSSFGSTSAHRFALMTSNTNRLQIDSAGLIGINTTPSTYQVNINGSLNATTIYQNGSLLDLTNLSYLSSITLGSISASKAVVVDANRDISGFRSIYSVNSTAYTPLTFTQTGGVSVALQLNSSGTSYWGPTSAHAFNIQTSNSPRIHIQADGKVGINTTSNTTYQMSVNGSLNCSQLYLNGSLFSPSDTVFDKYLGNKFCLNQTAFSSSKYYAFDNFTTPQQYLSWEPTGVTGDSNGAICSTSGIGGISIRETYNRVIGRINTIQLALCNDYRSSVYRNQLALRCDNIGNDSFCDWMWVDTSSTYSSNYMTWRAGSTGASPALTIYPFNRTVGVNALSLDPLAQLHVNGMIRVTGGSGIWIGDTAISSSNLTERPIVALNSAMGANSNTNIILGKSLSNYNCGIMKYVHVADGGRNRIQLGFFAYDQVLTVDTFGRCGINNTSPRVPLEVSGSDSLTFGAGGTSYTVYQHNLANNPVSSSTASGLGPYTVNGVSAVFNGIVFTQSIYATSDKRLKDNVEKLDVDLERYKKINPVSFTYKSEPQKVKIGLIAQELLEVSSEMIELLPNEEMDDGVQLNVDYGQLAVVNTSVIKKILARLEALEAKFS